MTNVKRIESYGLYDFCQDVQAALQEGYVFDFDTNENFPTAYGTMLTCGLVKPNENVEVVQAETEIVPQDEQTEEIVKDVEQVSTEVQDTVTEVEEVSEAEPAKRGPKPKAK